MIEDQPFIDCNIWEINMFPKKGDEYNYYTINNIFYYNSLTDKTFERSTAGLIYQIPENIIKNENKNFILKNKDYIIKNKCPVIKKQLINGEDVWSIDLNETNITL
jgi:hypothetical protein